MDENEMGEVHHTGSQEQLVLAEREGGGGGEEEAALKEAAAAEVKGDGVKGEEVAKSEEQEEPKKEAKEEAKKEAKEEPREEQELQELKGEKEPEQGQEAKEEGKGKDKEEFQAHWYRWVNLFIFSLLTLLFNLYAYTFAPIADAMLVYYVNVPSIDSLLINILSAVVLVTAVPLFIWGPRLIDRLSLRISMILLSVSVAIGVILRYAVCQPTEVGFWLVFVGQTIMSLGQLVTWAGPTKLSMVWFPEGERPLATSLAAMSNLLGVAAAFLFCPMSVPTGLDDQVTRMLMIHMIIWLGASFFGVLLFRPTPPTPPSKSSTALFKSDEEALDHELAIPPTHWGQYKLLFKNRSFMLTTVCFSLGYGYFNGLFTVLNQMMIPLGYTNADVGVCGVVLIMCGVLGAGISGAIVSKTFRYKEVICAALLIACGMILWFALALVPNNMVVIASSLACLGFFALAITPVALEVAVEYTYPIPESTSSGFLCAFGNLLALAYIGVMSFVTAQAWIGLGTFIVTFLIALFLGRDYRRLNFDHA